MTVATAANNAANHDAVAVMNGVIIQTALCPAFGGPPCVSSTELLSVDVKTPGGGHDLVVDFDAVCGIALGTDSYFEFFTSAQARVIVWETINGDPIPAIPNPTGVFPIQESRILLCGGFTSVTDFNVGVGSDEPDLFTRSANANGYTWIAHNPGAGTHTVKIYGRFVAGTVGGLGPTWTNAAGLVGRSVLEVRQTKIMND